VDSFFPSSVFSAKELNLWAGVGEKPGTVPPGISAGGAPIAIPRPLGDSPGSAPQAIPKWLPASPRQELSCSIYWGRGWGVCVCVGSHSDSGQAL